MEHSIVPVVIAFLLFYCNNFRLEKNIIRLVCKVIADVVVLHHFHVGFDQIGIFRPGHEKDTFELLVFHWVPSRKTIEVISRMKKRAAALCNFPP